MQKFLPLIVFIIFLQMLTAQNSEHLAVNEPSNHPKKSLLPHTSELAAQKIMVIDTSGRHAHIDQNLIDHQERQNWIRETTIILEKLSGPSEEQIIEKSTTVLDDFFQAGYRVQGSGYIRFDNGEWIYLVSNSTHDNARIGDITIAVDNQQRIWINEGHICGGIIHFITNDNKAVNAASVFFENFISDTDDRGWKSLNMECMKTSFTSK